jgi:CRISPR-associated protein Csd2
MTTLSKKVDFAVIFRVENANPNGDPLNENIPRILSDGKGEVTDVCIKRKIRNRLLDAGQSILVQSNDYKAKDDEFYCIKDRLDGVIGKLEFPKNAKDEDKEKIKKEYIAKACNSFFDIRTFGQVIAWDNTSIGIRGPVTIQSAFSLNKIAPVSLQITKSVSNEEADKGSDTMGMKHRIRYAIYVTYGAINSQLAKKTGFSDDDADAIKAVLPKLFNNDASSARPEGSMEVLNVVWWKHNSEAGQYSSARVHNTLRNKENIFDKIDIDGNILNEKALKEGTIDDIKGLKAEIIKGW